MEKKFELKPFDKVLVRDDDDEEWRCSLYSHESDEVHYCINGYWVQCIPFEGNEHLLGTTDAYVEPYEPKDGDFVYAEGYHNHILIFSEKADNMIYAYVELFNERKIHINEDVGLIENFKIIRPVTEEEKQLLLSKLHEAGKDWDAEKKEIVDWKWKPNRDDTYYYPPYDNVHCYFKVGESTWINTAADKLRYERGCVFKTKEEAESFCEKMNSSIANFK